MYRPRLLISSGQDGAERTALECARNLGIATGGFAPRGFITASTFVRPTVRVKQKGSTIAPSSDLEHTYGLQQLESTNRDHAIAANVVAADMVLLWGFEGTAELNSAIVHCKGLKKRHYVNPSIPDLKAVMEKHKPEVVYVSGNRDSVHPYIEDVVTRHLCGAFE